MLSVFPLDSESLLKETHQCIVQDILGQGGIFCFCLSLDVAIHFT